MTSDTIDLPDLLRTMQKDAIQLAETLGGSAVLRMWHPNVPYQLRRAVLLLQAAIDEADELAAAARGPSTRELQHRLHELRVAGVVTPHAFWGPAIAEKGNAA